MDETGNNHNHYEDILNDYFGSTTTIQFKEKEKIFDAYQNDTEFIIEFKKYLENLLKKPNAYEKYFIISQALDRKRSLSKLFQAHANLIIKYSIEIVHKWLDSTEAFPQKHLQTVIRVMLQLLQVKQEKQMNELFCTEGEISELKSILLKLIGTENNSFDCVMLAGTCLLRLLCLYKSAKDINMEFLNLIEKTEITSAKQPVEFSDFEKSFVKKNQQITKLALINGLLNSNFWELLLFKMEKTPLLLLIFSDVCSLCEDKRYSFYAFQILLAWLRTFHKFYQQISSENTNNKQFIENHIVYSIQSLYPILNSEETYNEDRCFGVDPIFCKASSIFNSIWNLLSINWENNISGVPELVSQCFSILLELHFLEAALFCYEDSTIPDLVSCEMKLPWSKKSKYPPLAALLVHFGVEKFLKYYPFFPMEFVESLVSNPTASAGVDLYRTILLLKIEETSNIEKDLIDWWNYTWLPSFLEALNRPDNVMQQNLLRYWFPCTLKVLPSVYSCMIDALGKHHSDRFKNALVTVIKIARNLGIINLSVLDINPIKESLYHSDDMIRVQAIAILCSSNKKAEPLTTVEMKLIEEFLILNLNIDNAPFRQHLITQLKIMLIRLRDSGINALSSKADSKEFIESLKFVDRIFKLVISNLFPGSCYQRRRTCLDIISTIFDVFISELPARRKGNVPKKTSNLVDFAQDCGLWQFTQENVFQSLLCCLQDFMSETKEITVQILEKYFSWDHIILTQELLENFAFSWVCSPKPHVCESGALLFYLIFKKIVLKSEDYKEIEEYFDFLLSSLNNQYKLAQNNIFDASRNYPLHGLVLTLKLCMMDDFCNQAETYHLSLLANRILQVMEAICNYIIGVLGSKITTSSYQMPSFADMSEAIEEILDETGVELSGENSALSAEYQLILSCCWINLKECSFSIANLVAKCIENSDSSCEILPPVQIRKAGDLLINIMMKCRHKGVIEACQIALGQFSHCLLSQSNVDYQKIPFDMLKNALQIIETTATASVTRRSAGLPLLILAIVSNETSLYNRPLLEYGLNKLLHIANIPLPEDRSEIADLPQAHALHILKTLVHDAHLAQSFHLYMSSLIELCIHNFISTSWCIRNASLQLYGALVPRLLGQKKVRDDNSQHNSLTADVLFSNHPKLAETLLKYLKETLKKPHATHSSMIPVLMLLAKLTPSYSHDENIGLLSSYCEILDDCLNSPVIAVRYLASNAVVALNPLDPYSLMFSTVQKLKNSHSIKTNQIHGCLLIIKRLLSTIQFSNASQMEEFFSHLKECIHLVGHPSLIIRTLFLKIIQALPQNLKEEIIGIIKNSFSSLCKIEQSWKPGIAEWNQLLTEIKFDAIAEEDILNIIRDNLNGEEKNQDKINGCLNYLNHYIAKPLNMKFNLQLQEQIINFVCKYPHTFHIEKSFQLLIHLFQKADPYLYHELLWETTTIKFFQAAMKGTYGISVTAITTVMLGHSINAMLLQHISLEDCFEIISEWTTQIRGYCSPLQTEDLRIKTAESFHIACPQLLLVLESSSHHERNKIITFIFDSAVDLLMDENFEVRQIITKFVSTLPRTNLQVQLYKSINSNYALKILNAYFVEKFSNDLLMINYLWDKLRISGNPLKKWSCQNYCEKNLILFDQEDINIYAEQSELIRIYTYSLVDALQKTTLNTDILEQWFEKYSYLTLEQTNHVMTFLQEEIIKSKFWCFSNVVQNKMYLNIFKACCQVKVMLAISEQLCLAKQSEWETIYNDLESFNFDIFGYCFD